MESLFLDNFLKLVKEVFLSLEEFHRPKVKDGYQKCGQNLKFYLDHLIYNCYV